MTFLFFLVICFFNFSREQTVTVENKFTYELNWNEGWYSAPVFYEKDSSTAYVCASTYWAVFCLDAYTGAEIWYKNGYNNAAFEGRFDGGLVLVEDFLEEGDVVLLSGADNVELIVWDLFTGDILQQKNVVSNYGRWITSLIVDKFHESEPWTIVVGLPTTAMVSGHRSPNTWFLYPDLTEKMSALPLTDSEEGEHTLGVFGKNQAIYDFNGDGYKSIIVPSDDYAVCFWSHDGTMHGVNQTMFYNADNMWGHVIFSKVYKNEYRGWAGSTDDLKPFFAHGIATVVPVSSEKNVIAISGLYASGFDVGQENYQYHSIFVVNEDRSRYVDESLGHDWRPSWDDCSNFHSGGINTIQINIAYADLNGNGYPELIFPCSDGRVHAVGLDQNPVYNWPFSLGGTSTAFRFASEVAIFQRPSEGPIVVFSSWATTAETTYMGYIYFLNNQGNQIQRITLPKRDSTTMNGGITGVSLFRFSKNTNYTQNLHFVIETKQADTLVYEIKNTETAEILWQTQRGNFRRTGNPNDHKTYSFVEPPGDGPTVLQIVFASVIGTGLLIYSIITIIGVVLIVIFTVIALSVVPSVITKLKDGKSDEEIKKEIKNVKLKEKLNNKKTRKQKN